MKTKVLSLCILFLMITWTQLVWSSNIITYISTDGKVDPYNPNAFGAKLISNEYDAVDGIGTLTFDGEVSMIGENAFMNCSRLFVIDIPISVKSIGSNAFRNCSNIEWITIPLSVREIGAYAFSYCNNLRDIRLNMIPPTCSTTTFEGTNITSISVPMNYAERYQSATVWNQFSIFQYFIDPTKVDDIYYDLYPDGFTAEVTQLTNSGYYIDEPTGDVVIPSSINYAGYTFMVTGITREALCSGSAITSISIPPTVTRIDKGAFCYFSSLQKIRVGENPPSFYGDSWWTPFAGISSTCTLIVPPGCESKYANAYGWSNFTNIIEYGDIAICCPVRDGGTNEFITTTEFIPCDLRLDWGSRHQQSFCVLAVDTSTGEILKDVEWSSNECVYLATDSHYGFQDPNIPQQYIEAQKPGLASVSVRTTDGTNRSASVEFRVLADFETSGQCGKDLYYDLTYIGSGWNLNGPYALTITGSGDMDERYEEYFDYETKPYQILESAITLPEGMTSITMGYLNGQPLLTQLKLPSTLRKIGSGAFYGTGLTSINLPGSLESIGFSAFANCTSLTSIEIPSSVTSIGNAVFDGCSSLTSIYVTNNIATCDEQAFSSISNTCTLYVPYGYKTAYQNAPGWSEFTNIVEYGGNYITYTSSDGRVVSSPYLTDAFGANIISNVYQNGKGTITFDSEITSIGAFAFYLCSSLISIELPSSVTSIDAWAFSGCTSLITIEFPSNVASIGQEAFSSCSSLSSIELPSSVTSIGENAFAECSSLTSIDIPSNVISIGVGAFYGCNSLTSIEIPSSVTSIGFVAFSGCSSLNSIVVDSNNHNYDSRDNCNAIIESATNTLIAGCYSTVIPSSVTNIGNQAFARGSLTSISIPSSVISIGISAFSGCTSLTSMYVTENIPGCAIGEYTSSFNGITNTCTLYVPYGYKLAYQNAPGWKEFTKIVEIGGPTDISQYEDVLYIESAEVATGRPATLSILLNNIKSLTGFQGDIILPDGCSFVFDEYGFAEAELTEVRTNSKVMSFDAEVQEDGSLRLLVYSSKNIAFTGNEGEVATVTIEVDSELEDGEYLIQLKNIVLTEASGKTIEIDKVITTLTVFSYMLGDANGDRKVNVGDLAATASHILGNTPDNFVAKAADANEDTKINVGDLAKIASIILGTANSAPQRAAAIGETCFEVNMQVEPAADNEYLLHIGINNEGVNFSGFQFDLQLPEGLNVGVDAYGYAEAELSTERTTARRTDIFDSAFMEDGSLRVLCASTSNAMFEGESGEVATIRLVADESFVGEGVLSLTQIFYTAIGEGLEAADVVMDFQNAISSIRNISMNVASKVYDMNGVAVGTTVDIESLPKGIYVVDGKKVVK